MTPGQIRDRIRELEYQFSRIREAFFRVAHGQDAGPRESSEEAISEETGAIGEDLTRDR